MSKLNMILIPKDEDKINLLNDKYGLTQNIELIGFLITHMAKQVSKEKEKDIEKKNEEQQVNEYYT
jgi:hypothetical protein